jgi:hypothetical protein
MEDTISATWPSSNRGTNDSYFHITVPADAVILLKPHEDRAYVSQAQDRNIVDASAPSSISPSVLRRRRGVPYI